MMRLFGLCVIVLCLCVITCVLQSHSFLMATEKSKATQIHPRDELATDVGDDADSRGRRSGIVQVAVFNDGGVSKRSLGHLLSDLQQNSLLHTQQVTSADIRAGQLSEFDVVIFPGGSGGGQAKSLGKTGREIVRKFVTDGGGYIGICAGAYPASADYDWSLHILDAKVLDRKHWARGFGNVRLKASAAATKSLGFQTSEPLVYYHQGPLLSPAHDDQIPDYQEWASFTTEVTKEGVPGGVMPGTTAIAAGIFGDGRVLAISPHPENTDGLDHVLPRAVQWAISGRYNGSPMKAKDD